MHEIDANQLERMNEFERRSMLGLLRSEFYLKAPPKVQEVLRNRPPYMIYELKDNNQFVYIKEIHEDKDDAEKPVLIEVEAHPQYNEGLLAIHKYVGVPPEALTPVIHRSIIDQERLISRAQRTYMPTLANRVQAVNRARRVERERFVERKLHAESKEIKTSFSLANLNKEIKIIKPGELP